MSKKKNGTLAEDVTLRKNVSVAIGYGFDRLYLKQLTKCQTILAYLHVYSLRIVFFSATYFHWRFGVLALNSIEPIHVSNANLETLNILLLLSETKFNKLINEIKFPM